MAKSKDSKETAGAKENADRSSQIEIEVNNSDEDLSTEGEQNNVNAAAEPAPESTEQALAAEKDKYLRLAAEYDNFRKRTAKERDMTYGMAQADTITKLLPVYDSLERALKQAGAGEADEAHYKGIELIMQQLTEILKDMGVLPIPAPGEKFDANVHHAVLRIEDPELGEGIVAEETLKGFTLGDRVIRFSEVIVAN